MNPNIIPWLAAIAIFALIAVVIHQDRKSNKKKDPDPVAPEALPYPCIIEGSFSCPDRAVAIASRNARILSKGLALIIPDEPDNNTHPNNTALGGGTPYGGIYLAGNLRLEVGADGQIKQGSYITVFSNEQFVVTGGIEPTGKIGMASIVGVSIGGSVSKEGTVRVIVSEGGPTANSSPEANDPVWKGLSPVDQANLSGNVFGTTTQYVHGVGNPTYARS
jgi:hypothetical protein